MATNRNGHADKVGAVSAGSTGLPPSDQGSDGENQGSAISRIPEEYLPGPIRDTGADRVSAARGFVEGLKASTSGKAFAAPPDEQLRTHFLFLWELLTVSAYKDGSARVLPEIVIRRIDGAYEAILRDHASRQQKACWFLSLEELSSALEDVLCDAKRPWKPYDSYIVPAPKEEVAGKGDGKKKG